MDNSKCVILTPTHEYVEPKTDIALTELQNRGYEIRRMRRFVYLDMIRSIMASKALADGYDELMWIDSDIIFDPDDVDKLRSYDKPVICGIYPFKRQEGGGICARLAKGCDEIVFGKGGGLLELQWAATGFLYTRREVYEAIKKKYDLPDCEYSSFGKATPYFFPLLYKDGDDWLHLGEDLSFCERAHQCGYKIYADTTIRIKHIGLYEYSWEDFGGDRQRVDTCHMALKVTGDDSSSNKGG